MLSIQWTRLIGSHRTNRFKQISYLFFLLFIYLFIYGCVGSSFLCEGFLQLRQVGTTSHHGARASHRRSLSCCGAQAPDAQAQWLWLTGLVAPRHVGSSQTRARTRVPCIGRQTLSHCATREALLLVLRPTSVSMDFSVFGLWNWITRFVSFCNILCIHWKTTIL